MGCPFWADWSSLNIAESARGAGGAGLTLPVTTLRPVDKTVAGADLDAAATKIQAVFRGKVARQLVKIKLHAIAAIGRVKLHGQSDGSPLQTEGEDKDDARESARNAPGIIICLFLMLMIV